MRNILFKAKRLDNGEWVEGYAVNYGFTGKQKWHIVPFWASDLYSYEIDPSTICQYTGLTDKNGNKIWENDIVKYHFGDDVAEIKFGEYQSCFDSQKTCHVGFYVDWQKGYLRKDLGYWVKMIDCNIIGNEIDNPELLEEQSNEEVQEEEREV